MRLLILGAIIFTLVGCGQRSISQQVSDEFPPIVYQIDPSDGLTVHVPGRTIHLIVERNFPNVRSFTLDDQLYVLPDVDWMEEVAEIYTNSPYRIPYHGLYDCDDQTAHFTAIISMIHFENNKHSTPLRVGTTLFPSDGIAIGEIHYRPDSNVDPRMSVGHAINIIIMFSEGQVGFGLYDPSLGGFVTLSEAEKESVWLVRF